MKKILCILSLIMLTACSCPPRVVEKEKFKLPDDIFSDCRDIQHTKGTTDMELLEWSKETLKAYSECRTANNEKKKVLQKLQKTLN